MNRQWEKQSFYSASGAAAFLLLLFFGCNQWRLQQQLNFTGESHLTHLPFVLSSDSVVF